MSRLCSIHTAHTAHTHNTIPHVECMQKLLNKSYHMCHGFVSMHSKLFFFFHIFVFVNDAFFQLAVQEFMYFNQRSEKKNMSWFLVFFNFNI